MPEAGVLNPGDKINAPTIVIPGEETDDPNTPADERLLRKEHGFFNFPGLPTSQWMSNLTFFGKEHRGESFRESGYLF